MAPLHDEHASPANAALVTRSRDPQIGNSPRSSLIVIILDINFGAVLFMLVFMLIKCVYYQGWTSVSNIVLITKSSDNACLRVCVALYTLFV